MKNTAIEWCDHTFNPWSGCTKVSPGCANCYAETLAKRAPKTLGGWGAGVPRRRTSVDYWRGPVKWNRDAEEGLARWQDRRDRWIADGQAQHGPGREWLSRHDAAKPARPRVFCASLADWLDDEAPVEWLADLLELIHKTPHLDWLLLTKRPENWRTRVGAAADVIMRRGGDARWLFHWCVSHTAPANIWIGTTVEDQKRADERIPELLKIPARVRFLSCEPLLGPVNLHLDYELGAYTEGNPTALRASRSAAIHWVICGGESGPKARPMHPEWAQSLRDQCQAAGVAFFFKQWGEWAPQTQVPATALTERTAESALYIHTDGTTCPASHGARADRVTIQRVGKSAAVRLLDGVEHSAFPEVAA